MHKLAHGCDMTRHGTGGLVLLAWVLISACVSQARQSGQLTVPVPSDAVVAVMSSNIASTPSLEAMGRSLSLGVRRRFHQG